MQQSINLISPEQLAGIVEAAVTKAVAELPVIAGAQRWMTQEQCADYTGISIQQLSIWRMKKEGMPFVRVGPRMVRYDRLEVDRFMASFSVDVGGPNG